MGVPPSVLGARVASLRREQRLTQGQLAKYARVERSWLSLLETGRIENPGYARLAAIASRLGTTVDDLTDFQPPERQPLSLNDATVEYLARQPIEVPVVEQVASAGEGQTVLEYVYLPPARATSRNLIGLRVKGQSMEPEITDGSIVIIDRDLEPRSGQIVVATVGDQTFIKRLERRAGHQLLTGNSGAIAADEAKIEGVVIQTINDVPH